MTTDLQDKDNSSVVVCNKNSVDAWTLDLMNVVLVAAASHIENGNKMTQHTDALKNLIPQQLLEIY
jgi:hypothetical protein